MIKRVIFNNDGGVAVRYESGQRKCYPNDRIPGTVINFISEKGVIKTVEADGQWVKYDRR